MGRQSTGMSDDFTHSGYRALIAVFLKRGYRVTRFDEARPEEPHLILRHDIDMSLQAAEPIAEIEHELDVSGTYFVLLRTEMYNLFSAAAQISLARIRELGHEIGLHFDASLYDNDLTTLDAAADKECRILEDATGAPVQVVSFHRPAKELLGYNKTLGGRRHAYEPLFFSEIGYISDSRGGWHHGYPLDHEAVHQGHALQLLTHPIWWGKEAGLDPTTTLERFVLQRGQFLEQELAANSEPFRALLKLRSPGQD